jgi:hypothetical protein
LTHTAINGASDLNQHQKDTLKAQANGAQRVSNAQDVLIICSALVTLVV